MGDENAGKAAGLELRALDAIFQNYGAHRVIFPLLYLIFWR
jgi:hypothetical protein